MQFTPDYNNRMDGGNEYATVMPGYYRVKILEAEFRTSERTGSKYLNLKLNIEEGEFEGSWLWATITTDHPSSAKAVDFGKKQLSEIAYQNKMQTMDLPGDLVFKDCLVRVIHESYNNEMRAKVKSIVSEEDFEKNGGNAPVAAAGGLNRTTTHQSKVNYDNDEPPF